MDEQFTLHCVGWKSAASLMLEARAAACRSGLLSQTEVLADEIDEHSCHAMVLNDSGKAIGCARIQPTGTVERVVVIPHEDRTRIEQALQLAGWLHGKSTSQCA